MYPCLPVFDPEDFDGELSRTAQTRRAGRRIISPNLFEY